MFFRNTLNFLLTVCCVGLLFTSGAFADYIEGIDTTDTDGYGLDSAFRVNNSILTGPDIIIRYVFSPGGATGYFNCSFDDITAAPLVPRYSFTPLQTGQIFYCFIVKKQKDSTYSKIQILKRVSGNRYTYRYGRNTTPNDRLLIRSDYDKTIRYKPNNIWNNYDYVLNSKDTLCWDAPIANNNHLKGYIFYYSKPGMVIDTTAPINPAQWDTVVLSDTTTQTTLLYNYFGYLGRYYNLVANYTEGHSDFLMGWTIQGGLRNEVRKPSPATPPAPNPLTLSKSAHGFSITASNNRTISAITILTPAGARVSRISGSRGSKIFWNTAGVREGMYFIKAELSDGGMETGRVMVLK